MAERDTQAHWGRRPFLKAAAVSATALCLPEGTSAAAPDASKVVQGKDSRLLVHGAFPQVLETPPELLTDQITPLDVLFVRNNQRMDAGATLKPLPLDNWRIDFQGLIGKSASIMASQLASMKQVTHEMVLQCCGNQRVLYAGTVKAKGTQWTRGGMANIKVTGVPLKAVLEKLGIRVKSGARFLTAEGKDAALPEKEDFEHSLPLGDALRYSLLALKFNDEPIPAVHGGPVRLMTLGYFGTMHMKWLHRLRFESRETDNYNQIPRYRTPRRPLKPGTPVKYSFANSKACWRMKLKSVILSPAPGAQVKPGKQLIRGVAFNDGQARVESVTVSMDRGKTWHRAELETPESPYAWYRWTLPVRLDQGEQEVWARAVDGLGRSQPLDGSIAWNPSGYEWNGVERVKIRVG